MVETNLCWFYLKKQKWSELSEMARTFIRKNSQFYGGTPPIYLFFERKKQKKSELSEMTRTLSGKKFRIFLMEDLGFLHAQTRE